MKIIIAGAGVTGTHLATLLSRENLDIVLMDEKEERLSPLDMNLDLMTVNYSPTSIHGLQEAGVKEADLFIAVTPEESENIASCLLARKFGCKQTVARINNNEYLSPDNQPLFQSMGVNTLIYPEALAAKEIASTGHFSWIRQWYEVQEGKLVMIGVKMREASPLLNTRLCDLGAPEKPYHIVAIQHQGKDHVTIPNGNDMVKADDMVYIMTLKEHLPYLRKLCGKETYPEVKNIMIMGAGKMAVETVKAMDKSLHLKVIEIDEKRIDEVQEIAKGHVMLIHGDGRDMGLLSEEGLDNTQIFIALTGNSERNLIACVAARKAGVRKTIARVDNYDYLKAAEDLDIGTVINKQTISASRIYELLLKADVTNMKTFTLMDADAAEFIVQAGSDVTKAPVKDLGLPHGATLGGMVRDGKGMLINGGTRIQAGDHVVVFCTGNKMRKLQRYFY